MERLQLKFLQKWIDKKKRKPLIIRGARQVGKTTLVEPCRVGNVVAHHLCKRLKPSFPKSTSSPKSFDLGLFL